MTYLVIVDKTPDNKIAKMQKYETKVEADAHVVRVAARYPNAFVVDNPGRFVLSHTTVDMVNKTMNYESAQFTTYETMRVWEMEMAKLQHKLPDFAEDIINGMNTTDRANINRRTLDRLAAKELLRSQRP